ncbi:MarR family winged helix-turn-helix transcriptional regulator [Ornithinibacillus sp. 179-J 7C1 HS]|uniref:MarR family winged helix-turn-helix transcriptional regulator n=1 Tax=Ornithinibacillus sp. 179-J 7C1 HS TaxID=3142384 RepID=UPI0039A150FB
MELKELIERYQSSINQVYRSVNLILKDKIQSDLTSDQFSTMHFIYKKQRCTSTEIANEFGIGKSAVTAQITRLYDKGLIVRNRDDDDRRVIYLHVTEKGIEFVENTEKALFQELGTYLSHFDDEEIYMFIHTLEKLAKKMKEE